MKLEYTSGGLGYLPSLLKNLDINVDSQLLVFSKTSFQQTKISPWAPRAVFFNDNVAVGSVQGGDMLELAALDPKQGVIFYMLDAKRSAKPTFDRRSDCLQCHQGITTLGITGIVVTSVYPSGDGTPAFRGAALATDDRTPFADRWGGWYVTGTMGSARHMGNAVAHDSAQPRNLDMAGSQNLTSLGRRFDAMNYLAKTSDIVALMTLEHQTRMTNLMIRTAWDARVALYKGKLYSEANERIDGDVEAIVTYMLYEKTAHEKGVKRVCIPNRNTKSAERKREQKKRSFREGQKWRTGCEGRINVVKRRHGLNRCRDKGDRGMQRWVGLGVISDNLINIGRALTRQSKAIIPAVD